MPSKTLDAAWVCSSRVREPPSSTAVKSRACCSNCPAGLTRPSTTCCEIRYDNYGGSWGDPKELDRFLQAYAIEKAKLEAHKAGHTFREHELADGSVKLTIQVA